MRRGFLSVFAIALLIVPGQSSLPGAHEIRAPNDSTSVVINENRTPAGELHGESLDLRLRAAAGRWRPEGDAGPELEIEAFGEGLGPLQVPAPLIRVHEGTEIVASIRNDLGHSLRVHGLCSRDGTPCPPIDVPPAAHRETRFKAGRAGTYHYWATTTAMPLPFRATGDTQLSGAFIVDPPQTTAPADRVLVITDWTSLTRDELMTVAKADDPGVAFFARNPRFTFALNGLAWPSTERLIYRIGDDVRWRVINLSSQPHPMHLHGFYFVVDSLGNGNADTVFDAERRRRVVTQVLNPGETMAMRWRPEREGNWVFHCHISEHISPERRLSPAPPASHDHDMSHDIRAGMAGLVLGVTVRPQGDSSPDETISAIPVRKLTLTMTTEPQTGSSHPSFAFSSTEGTDTSPTSKATVPGPTLVLRRGEPVEISLVNQLRESTAIHWHGMELDSYYDGVHGWSGTGSRVTPLIHPGASFPVRFTPPRTGTFIYHTHMHDNRQLTGGLYGAMLVLEPGEAFDPAVDHVIVIGRDGPGRDAPVVLNGRRDSLMVWKAGSRHRLRFINITPDDIFVTSLSTAEGPVEWIPLTKDGAAVPLPDRAARPATQTMAVGETFDFVYDAPAGRRGLWINVRTPGGKWAVQGRVVVK